MKGDPQAHRSRSPSCECGPECVPAWPGCPEGISWAWWSQQGRADISSLCRAALLGRAWTVSHPRPPERSGEPGGPEHGEAGVRGAGLGQTPKVGAGRRVGWDVAWGCPPSPAGDEEHWALAMVAEPVCDGFWQRQLIKTGGFTGSRLRQGSGRLSLLCRRWATLPQMWFGGQVEGRGDTEVLASAPVVLSCAMAHSGSAGSLPGQGWDVCCILTTRQGQAQWSPTTLSEVPEEIRSLPR